VLVARLAADQLAMVESDDLVSPGLIGALSDNRDQVVIEAARCLGLRQSRSALEPLRSLAGHSSVDVRAAAFDAIGRMAGPELIPWLLDEVKKQPGLARAAINRSFGRLKTAAAVEHLITDCQYPDKLSKGLQPALFTPMSRPPDYPPSDTAVAADAVWALGQIGDRAAVPILVTVSRDVLRNEQFWTAVVVSLGQLGDPAASPALVELGVTGSIGQGMLSVAMPVQTRISALQSIVQLELKDTVDAILGMDPALAPTPVRQAAAEALTRLTGTEYGYRLPTYLGAFFIDDRANEEPAAAISLPMFCPVKER
jgi:HEAT repeat protein